MAKRRPLKSEKPTDGEILASLKKIIRADKADAPAVPKTMPSRFAALHNHDEET